MKMRMTMLVILSSIVIEVIRTVSFFFFMKDILNVKKTNKTIKVTFNQIFLNKQKHLSNIQADISKQKKST